MSLQHKGIRITPDALRLGSDPQNWKSATKGSEEVNVREESKWICLRVFSLLLWLNMTSKEKFAGELDGAGTLG